MADLPSDLPPTPWGNSLPPFHYHHSQQQQEPANLAIHELPLVDFALNYHDPAQTIAADAVDIGSFLHELQVISTADAPTSTSPDIEHDAHIPPPDVASSVSSSDDTDIAASSTPVTCPLCNITLKNQKNLRSHMNTHGGPKNFHCTLCPKSFLRSNQLKSHNKMHTGERPYECQICLKTFSQSSNFLVHKNTHFEMPADGTALPFQCDVCQRSFAQQVYLKAHMRVHTVRDPMRCRLCRRRFTEQTELDTHQREHIDVNRFRCLVCDKQFERYINLKNHRFTHNGLKPHVCQVCGKGFSHTTPLAVHMRTHTGERPYACPHCSSTFSQWANYNRHLGTHLREPVQHECPVPECGKKFDKASSLKSHARSHNKDRSLDTARASWDCEVCGRVFWNHGTYENHRETHRQQCAECGAKVSGPRAYREHMQSVHGQYQHRALRLRCEICDNRYQNVGQMRRHMREAHTSEEVQQQQLFKCDECDVKGNEFELEAHVRGRHEAYLRHGCPHCRLDFAHIDLLLKHLQEHLGQKQCEQCGKVFKNVGQYKRHQCVRAAYTREMEERELEKRRRVEMKEAKKAQAVNECAEGKEKESSNDDVDEMNEPLIKRSQSDGGSGNVKDVCDSDISYEFLLTYTEEPAEPALKSDVLEHFRDKVEAIKPECDTKDSDKSDEDHSDDDGRDDEDTGNNADNSSDSSTDESSASEKPKKSPKTGTFTCTACPRYFNTAKRLRHHFNRTHLKRCFQCDQCAHTFLRRAELASHQRSHTGDRPYQCEICSKCFTQLSALYTHKRVHTGERPFACSVCPKRFKQTSARQRHEALHTSAKPFPCQRCSRTFASADVLSVHERRVHDRPPIDLKLPRGRPPRPKPPCPIRVQQTRPAADADDVADDNIDTGTVAEPNAPPYDDSRPYACTVCSKTFAKSCTLWVHSKIHTGEKHHRCDRCPKAFAQAVNLKRHQRSHSGRRPFNCFECTKWFAKQETLDAHIMLHREQERAAAVTVLQVAGVQPAITAIVVNGGGGVLPQ